jgi:hypothetical protein
VTKRYFRIPTIIIADEMARSTRFRVHGKTEVPDRAIIDGRDAFDEYLLGGSSVSSTR